MKKSCIDKIGKEFDDSALLALAIDEFYNTRHKATEGERVLEILQKSGFIGSLPDVEDLSENYKDYLDWSDKT